jgi:hypothetical protein
MYCVSHKNGLTRKCTSKAYAQIDVCLAPNTAATCIAHILNSGVMSVVAALLWIFSLRLSVIHVQVWYISDLRWPRGKNLGVSSPGILVAIQLAPCAQTVTQEKLHPTSFVPYWQNDVMLHPAGSKSDVIVWVTFHSHTVPTHHSTTGCISWRSLLLPDILVSKNGTMCHAPHFYLWVNLVISINCDMRIILLPVHVVASFTYLLKWKCISLLNMVSSTQILFDLHPS